MKRLTKPAAAALTLLVVAAALGRPGVASAQERGPALRAGTYFARWHNDKVKFIVDRVDRDGRFSGRAEFTPGSNFPGVRFGFTGRVARDDSIVVRRQWSGGEQVARAGTPSSDGWNLVWRGDVQGTGLTQAFPFELFVPLPW